jgi:hypothetical protein
LVLVAAVAGCQVDEVRDKRCRMVVHNSWQLGEWEKAPGTPRADPTALITASMRALAAPI